ncbi:hypothetical protein AMS68_007309 [Peltaster fructicola]|uniref:IPT/TIG domain-containing protein n=1 Tax=Peltaster fructicola TaxID=286661 RepID=A0A6H0Y444_9PEZI|nr:hypothetical protein AMS68_007309 [Peltaster fructicola]
MGDSSVDWNDPVFGSTQFEDAMPAESPFSGAGGAGNAFENYTNMSDFVDSPGSGGLTMRKSSKPTLDFAPTPSNHMHMLTNRSAESSSQDSASDTSSSRKRKTTSESPASDAQDGHDKSRLIMKSEGMVDMGDRQQMHTRSAHIDMPQQQQHMSASNALFDFNSNASSPINPGAFDAALSLDEQVHGMMMPQVSRGFNQTSPVQTINPATFTLDGSRDHSPSTNAMMFTNASPHAMFSTPSSESNEAFNPVPGWHNNLSQQNPAWNNDFNSTAHFSPTGGLGFTPSPTSGMSLGSGRKGSTRPGRSRLHIAPISTKSRVETQISIIMTLETPPPGIEFLHLPLQTIAKSKLLAKEEVDSTKVLELHTMLVCTSAMRNAQLKAKALRRAAAQNNLEIQQRAEAQRETGDEDKNDPKLVADEDKPCNGGEVRICNNCIQRERKRAARKKLKKEEEQQHWERYETERVVVFNSNELLPFKAWEAAPQKESAHTDEYVAPDGAIQVSAAMRIACYCRHQNEKEGFQVIFTMKDAEGNVVAQDVSDSILITDDHKTHPPTFPGQMSDQMMFGAGSNYSSHGLPTSYSMVDMSQHVQPGFTSSRSTGNLQGLAYGNQYNQGHVHQMQSGTFSQTTSASMTPTNSLSRPGSPTSAGNSGPNKKRKSSSFHRKVPSGLTMTPRVDTTVPPTTSAAPSAVSIMSQFSPTTPGSAFPGQEQSFMNMGSAVNAQYIGSGPSTPSDNLQYANQQLSQSRSNTQQVPDYYQSLPSSRVNSRAPSPVMQANRPYPRQQMQPGAANRGQMFAQGMQPQVEPDTSALPMIHKITPTEGPVAGGTEVSIYGRDFAQGMQVYFGDQPATAITFYGEQALLCTSPPGRVGGVQVTVLPVGHVPQYNPSQMNRPVFTYKNANEKVMEMALRFVSQQQTGNSGAWWQVTQQNATRWMQQTINRSAGFPTGFEGNVMSAPPAVLERMVNNVVDAFDLAEVADPSALDATFITGETPLSLACAAGLQEPVRALLVRGANPDGRDMNGFTPLMHAALHSKIPIFKLLITRGADPSIRSLSGYTAMDVAPADTQGSLQQILWSTPRSRLNRPYLKNRDSSASFASSRTSWDISSASMYESEDWCSDATRSPRRLSVNNNAFDSAIMEDDVTSDKQDTVTIKSYAPLPAAMIAVRDSITLQVQHFHQTLQKSIVQLHFAITPFPDLNERQDNALLRRLATVVHTLNETFPYLPTAPLGAVLPPAYSELYPETMHVTSDGIDFSLPPTKKSDPEQQIVPSATIATSTTKSEPESRMLTQWVLWLCVPIFFAMITLLFQAFSAKTGRTLSVLEAAQVVESIH